MKRQSSQSSHNSTSKHGALSPGSQGEYNLQPQRAHVKPAKRGHKVRLPQNVHGSGRNLVKLAQQAQNHQAAEERERKRHSGQKDKSRESDTEIRLPGSLDEHHIRFTGGTQLPRNTSHTKLKKNLSHGQLTRLGLERKGPPSPGLKGRSKRPRSADMVSQVVEKDLHQQEVEIAQQQADLKKDVPKKVGFAVGSYGDVSEAEDLPQMEGSGLPGGEDEWTDQSASASPFSTRQNTANNSRRASVIVAGEKGEERGKSGLGLVEGVEGKDQAQNDGVAMTQDEVEEDGSSADSEETDDEEEDNEKNALSPTTSLPQLKQASQQQPAQKQQPPAQAPSRRSLLQPTTAKEHTNPTTRRLLTRSSATAAAPALVSNVSALDDARSNGRGGSPAPSSLTSSRSNLGADNTADSGELVSRFMPSASHPETSASVPGTSVSTPKAGSLYAPEEEREGDKQAVRATDFASASPETSDLSRSVSLTTTPTPTTPPPPGKGSSRFRNDERMRNEKALAEREDSTFQPLVPAHHFDRRNETLKSWTNLERLGGDGRGGLDPLTGLPRERYAGGPLGQGLFEGRFKAVNAELKAVQRFRDPLGESMGRLRGCGGVELGRLRNSKAAAGQKPGGGGGAGGKLSGSKSAISLPKQHQQSKLSTSTSVSPPKPALVSAKSASQIKRLSSGAAGGKGKVTFSGVGAEFERGEEGDAGKGKRGAGASGTADEVARRFWESYGGA